MLYISTQVSRKWPRRTRQMEVSGISPQTRDRSLEDRQRCAGWMQTHSRWSRFASIWKSRKRSWTPVCLKLRSSFQRTFANAKVATTPSSSLPKEHADQVKERDCQTDTRTIKRAKVAKWTISKAAAARASGQKLKRVSKFDDLLDGCCRTWTSAHDATSTSPIMSSSSTIPSSSDLASLIYSTFILNHFMSDMNLELNLHKTFFS